MKTLPILAIAAAALVGCAPAPTTTRTTTTARTYSATDPSGQHRVYSRSDLDRSGRATTGAALRQVDPDVSGGGGY